MEQYRWYYNLATQVSNLELGFKTPKSISYFSLRTQVSKYSLGENKQVFLDETRTSLVVPPWWTDNDIHSRLPRGAIKKFTASKNSSLANYHAGNCKSKPIMKFMSSKQPTSFLSFEDCQYPTWINKIKGKYWFRTRRMKRTYLSLIEIIHGVGKASLEIHYDKYTKKFMIHYPVPVHWFPEEDRRNDNQVYSTSKRIIALDPGIRKFLVGFDPQKEEALFFGEKAHVDITKILLQIDKTAGNTHLLWKSINDKIADLHWKSIRYLVLNYDTILLPDFRVQHMIQGKLARITKRMMTMFSFHVFKERLMWMAQRYGKKVIIVDESYTSQTCTCCGNRKKTSSEIYRCKSCHQTFERDVMGARNILLKYITEHTDAGSVFDFYRVL